MNRIRKFWISCLGAAFLILAVRPAWGQIEGWPQLVSSSPITSGAVLSRYIGETSAGKTNFYVIEVDMDNPEVAVGIIPGAGKITQKLSVSEMAENTQAVAAVNGDFFNTRAEGSPIGPMIIDGVLRTSPSVLEGVYALGIDQNRRIHIEPFAFEGRVSAAGGNSFPLSGLNKTVYWEEPGSEHSHLNKLHLYDELWGAVTRGNDEYTIPTEVLVENGVVQEIAAGGYLPAAVPAGGYILRGDGEAANFLIENCVIGEPVKIEYRIIPDQGWIQVVGGHALLVDQGRAVPYTKDLEALKGARARTAAGMSRDGKTLYIVAAEARTLNSAGSTLADLADFLVKLGVWKAVNLDGGGSTTMVSRNLGDFTATKTFTPEQIAERPVVNALALFSLAPAGQSQNFFIEGSTLLLLGEVTPYLVKGYDEYFNPVTPGTVQWLESNGLGIFSGNSFSSLRPGVSQILGQMGETTLELPVQVVGKSDLAALSLTGGSGVVMPGSKIDLRLSLTTWQGEQRDIPAHLAEWQLYGIMGSVSPDGVLTITACPEDGVAFVAARYEGFSAPLALPVPSKELAESFADLESLGFAGYPQTVSGGIGLRSDPEASEHNVTELNYDFSQGNATMAAYVEFLEEGILLDESVSGFTLEVYGQQGNEWLRGEVIDANGSVHRLDIAASVNWNGWNTAAVNTQWIAKPAVLKRVYAAITDEGKSRRASTGSIFLKDLVLLRQPNLRQEKPVREIVIEPGVLEARLNGEPVRLEGARLAQEERVMVPVRFFSDIIGATVLWDEATRRCTIIDGGHWVDLWLDESLMAVDGKAVILEEAPALMDNRMMIPLKAVTESLGIELMSAE